MNVTYEQLRALAVETAAAEKVTLGESAMLVMTTSAMTMAADVPMTLRGALAAAVSRWFAREDAPESLDGRRMAAWHVLKDRGTSIVPRDHSDIAARALICICWDAPFESTEMEDNLEFFSSLLDQYRALSRPAPQDAR